MANVNPIPNLSLPITDPESHPYPLTHMLCIPIVLELSAIRTMPGTMTKSY